MSEKEQGIRRTVQLKVEDVIAANLLFAQRLRRTRAAWICPLLVGLAVTVIYLQPTSTGFGIALAAGLAATFATYALIWLVHLIVIPVSAGRAWREAVAMRQPTDYSLTADSLSFVKSSSSAQMAWHILSRWTANDRYLLIFNTRLTFYVLPRRDFDDEAVARIEGWLTQAGVPRY